MTSDLPELIDRAGLSAMNLTRRSIDHLYDRLPVIALPGQRKVYLRKRDVTEYLDAHTYDGRTKVRPR